MQSKVHFGDATTPVPERAAMDLHAQTDANKRQRTEGSSSYVPHVSDASALRDLVGSRALALFLDYDGTLAPIVDQPERAFISDETRSTLRSLAGAYPVALVSGRSNAKLVDFIQLDGLYFAGSHGVDIKGPSGEIINGPDPTAMVGPAAIAALDAARASLDERLADIPGYLTEHNEFNISAHYRMVAMPDQPRVHAAVQEVLSQQPLLAHKEGKMVHELRPRVAWDKGKAVEWLLGMIHTKRQQPQQQQTSEAAGAAVAQAAASSPAAETAVEAPASAAESTSGPAADFCAVYLGDDVADEDAFRAVASLGGIGIKVADGQVPRTSTAATWSVPQPQVVELLRSFLKEEAQ